MSELPPLGSGTTNELAKERNRAAAERTINLWIQTCVTLLGFGVALDQVIPGLQQHFPAQAPVSAIQLAHNLGPGFILLAIALLLLAMAQYQIAVQSIEQVNYFWLPAGWFNTAALGATLLFGALTITTILLQLY